MIKFNNYYYKRKSFYIQLLIVAILSAIAWYNLILMGDSVEPGTAESWKYTFMTLAAASTTLILAAMILCSTIKDRDAVLAVGIVLPKVKQYSMYISTILVVLTNSNSTMHYLVTTISLIAVAVAAEFGIYFLSPVTQDVMLKYNKDLNETDKKS